jgi:hypothetical protein
LLYRYKYILDIVAIFLGLEAGLFRFGLIIFEFYMVRGDIVMDYINGDNFILDKDCRNYYFRRILGSRDGIIYYFW